METQRASDFEALFGAPKSASVTPAESAEGETQIAEATPKPKRVRKLTTTTPSLLSRRLVRGTIEAQAGDYSRYGSVRSRAGLVSDPVRYAKFALRKDLPLAARAKTMGAISGLVEGKRA